MVRVGKYYIEKGASHFSTEEFCLKIWLTPKHLCHCLKRNHFCSLSGVKQDVQDFLAPDSFSLWLHLPITFQFFVCGSSVGWLQPWGLLVKNACPFHFPLAYLSTLKYSLYLPVTLILDNFSLICFIHTHTWGVSYVKLQQFLQSTEENYFCRGLNVLCCPSSLFSKAAVEYDLFTILRFRWVLKVHVLIRHFVVVLLGFDKWYKSATE